MGGTDPLQEKGQPQAASLASPAVIASFPSARLQRPESPISWVHHQPPVPFSFQFSSSEGTNPKISVPEEMVPLSGHTFCLKTKCKRDQPWECHLRCRRSRWKNRDTGAWGGEGRGVEIPVDTSAFCLHCQTKSEKVCARTGRT